MADDGTEAKSQASSGGDDFADVYVCQLRLADFRGIKNLQVELEVNTTLLVGPNNVGKSRILRALALALNAVTPDRDDLTVPESDQCYIDVIIAPALRDSDGDAVFDERISGRLGDDVQAISEDPIEERFAWRTHIVPSQEGLGVRLDQELLIFDLVANDWRTNESPQRLRSEQRNIISADLIQTRRDLADDFTRRGSAIRKILDDLEVPASERIEIEESLKGLGQEIAKSSATLKSVKAALDDLRASVDGIGHAELQPLPIRLEELARAISVELHDGIVSLPLRFHGSGARSLASLQVQSVLYDKRLGKDGPALRPRPLSIIEEPEAHLHPQAQFELAGLLSKLRGQVVVSTHSSHLVTVCDAESVRMLRAANGSLTVVDLKPAESVVPGTPRARQPRLHRSEMEKLKRFVERPFGELLFARLVVIGDGATERALLPPILRHVFGSRAQGVTVVDPGSLDNDHARAIVKFANLAGIPWVLFSDSDDSGVHAARSLVSELGDGDESKYIVWVPGEPSSDDGGAATEKMLFDFDSAMCVSACEALGFSCTVETVFKVMTKQKGGVGVYLAEQLVSSRPWIPTGVRHPDYWPAALANLCDKLDEVL